ncbi:hypothetical protein D3C73_1170300 [compost metagenome]
MLQPVPFDNQVVQGYLDGFQSFGFIGNSPDDSGDIPRFIIVQCNHGDALVRVVIFKMVQLASAVIMDDHDQLIAAARLHHELFADSRQIRFSIIHEVQSSSWMSFSSSIIHGNKCKVLHIVSGYWSLSAHIMRGIFKRIQQQPLLDQINNGIQRYCKHCGGSHRRMRRGDPGIVQALRQKNF